MSNVELDEVQWRSPEWIQAYGLRTDNVLDYFSLSPFYDKSSNNQVLKMQSNFNEQLQNNGTELLKGLQKMTGIEYQVKIAREPDLWVIVKQNRRSPTDTEVLAVYFVTGENIYQSPSIYNVLVSRILATSKFLEDALQIAEKLPEFTSSGYEYHNKPNDASTPSPESILHASDKETQAASQTGPQQQVNTHIQSQINKENTALLDRSLNITLGLLRSQQFRK